MICNEVSIIFSSRNSNYYSVEYIIIVVVFVGIIIIIIILLWFRDVRFQIAYRLAQVAFMGCDRHLLCNTIRVSIIIHNIAIKHER